MFAMGTIDLSTEESDSPRNPTKNFRIFSDTFWEEIFLQASLARQWHAKEGRGADRSGRQTGKIKGGKLKKEVKLIK